MYVSSCQPLSRSPPHRWLRKMADIDDYDLKGSPPHRVIKFDNKELDF
jgi:hypothetical protein